jgi:outer membrane protein insertion porin family
LQLRIERGAEAPLRFSQATADFSLSDIFSRRVRLTELRLLGGFSSGVGPESTTYKFIEHLTAPLPPELQTPDRWRLQLERIVLQNSGFDEPLPAGKIVGQEVSLVVQRVAEGRFDFTPTITNLSYKYGETGILSLGRVTGGVELVDGTFSLQRIHLGQDSSHVLIDAHVADAPKNPINGEASFIFESSSVKAGEWLSAVIYGKGAVGGILALPEFTGTFSNPADQPARWSALVDDPLPFTTVSGSLDLRWPEGSPQFTVGSMRGEGPGNSFSFSRPFIVSPDGLDGAATFSLSELKIGGVTFSDVRLQVTVKSPWSMPRLSFLVSAAQAIVGEQPLGAISGPIEWEGDTITFDLGTPLSLASVGTNSVILSLQGALQLVEDTSVGVQLLPTNVVIRTTPGIVPELRSALRLEGPFTSDLLSGTGTVLISAQDQALESRLVLQDGSVLIEPAPGTKGIALSGNLALSPLKQSTLALSVSQLNFLDFFPAEQRIDTALVTPTEKRCSSVSASAEYAFSSYKPTSGNGTLSLQEFSIGCAPFSVQLKAPIRSVIREGTLTLTPLTFAGPQSSLTVEGSVETGPTLALRTEGSLALPALAPLLGAIDDIQGTIDLDAALTGPLMEPTLSGIISIKDGRVDLASQGITLSQVNGTCKIQNRGVDFSGVSGRFNDGTFEISGRLEPLDIARSTATFSFKDLVLTPTDELSATLSGSVGIAPDPEGSPVLIGTIAVDGAEFRRTFNLAEMVRNTARSLLTPRQVLPALPSRASLPNIPMDIQLRAPGNVFIDTPWAAGELSIDLHIKGSVDSPQPEGGIEVLSGWVGLRDRRFEITNGRALFIPPSVDPKLELLAETTMRTRQGDVVLVFLEASGVASAPRLSLSSDRGLSEAEILSMLTSRSELGPTRTAARVSSGFELDTFKFIEDYSFLGLGRLVRDLARIDSLSIEPTFSVQRGTVEPTLVATKRLFDHLSLVGQTLIGSTANESSLRLVYDASPSLSIAGILDTYTQNRGSSVGVDLSYTLLGEQRRFLDIRLSGNRVVRTLDILDAIRINEDSRVVKTELRALEEKVVRFYQTQGFLSASAQVECAPVAGFSDDFCHQILINVEEGPPTYIREVLVLGDSPPNIRSLQALIRSARGSIASEENKRLFDAGMIGALRNEGYIAARVSSTFEEIDAEAPEERPGLRLTATLTLGAPVTFLFENATVFSPEEFLETIDLFGRRQPFGNNTISILLENVKRLYNEEGYLFASAKVEKQADDRSGRVIYRITIDEGPRLEVSEVIFEGLEALSQADLIAALQAEEPDAAPLIISPEVAVPEQLEVNTHTLRKVIELQGFPEAAVTHLVKPDETSGTVAIHYLIDEGAPVIASRVDFSGIPDGLATVPPVPAPLTIPRINHAVQLLSRQLSSAGYLESSIQTSFDENGAITIHVQPGTQARIANLKLEGYSLIEPRVIESHLLIKEGDPLNQDRIEESKRRLLRLGLFNRVTVTTEALSSGSSDYGVTIAVQERSPRTVSIGGGANSDLGLHVFGEAVDRGLFGDGRSITARLDTYYDRVEAKINQGIASLTYGDPLLLGEHYTYFSDLRFQRVELENQEFDLDRVSFANYAYRSRTEQSDIQGLSWSIGHTLLKEQLTNVTPGAIIGSFDSGDVRLGFVSSSLTFDRRDDPLNPQRGFSLQAESALASEVFGSEASYLNLRGRASFVTPLASRRWTFAAGSRAGVAWTLSDTDEIPISQRFYLGGRTTVRGFSENSLGPRGFDGAVQGGDFVFAQNTELRYLLHSNIEALTFIDVGGLFLRDQGIEGADIRESTGLGIRYRSPIGPIGFDIGIPLDRRSGESTYRFHFNIGTNF